MMDSSCGKLRLAVKSFGVGPEALRGQYTYYMHRWHDYCSYRADPADTSMPRDGDRSWWRQREAALEEEVAWGVGGGEGSESSMEGGRSDYVQDVFVCPFLVGGASLPKSLGVNGEWSSHLYGEVRFVVTIAKRDLVLRWPNEDVASLPTGGLKLDYDISWPEEIELPDNSGALTAIGGYGYAARQPFSFLMVTESSWDAPPSSLSLVQWGLRCDMGVSVGLGDWMRQQHYAAEADHANGAVKALHVHAAFEMWEAIGSVVVVDGATTVLRPRLQADSVDGQEPSRLMLAYGASNVGKRMVVEHVFHMRTGYLVENSNFKMKYVLVLGIVGVVVVGSATILLLCLLCPCCPRHKRRVALRNREAYLEAKRRAALDKFMQEGTYGRVPSSTYRVDISPHAAPAPSKHGMHGHPISSEVRPSKKPECV
eukprot:jgi/Mesvir1/17316/Mv07712-RA.2